MTFWVGFKRLPLLLLILLLLPFPAAVQAELPRRSHEEAVKLAPGQLLVAMPHLKDPNFKETVILLVSFGRGGAAGMIVNRPTDVSLSSEFPQLGDEHGVLFFGGPVGMHERLMVVAQTGLLGEADPLKNGLYFLHHSELFDSVINLTTPVNKFRVFAGYAGWGPMQLQREVIRGDWKVLPASAKLLFDVPSKQLWSHLIRYSDAQMAYNR